MLIDLNFLPLETSYFTIPIFRKKFNGEPKQKGFFVSKLPISKDGDTDNDYENYRVGLSSFQGATPYLFHSDKNPQLMVSIIWYYLKEWSEYLSRNTKAKIIIKDTFEKFVSFIVEDFNEGQRAINVHPYYLKATRQYGILLEFSFRKKLGVPFGREVQQLSFSLDRYGKSNVNSYLDQLNYIKDFIKKKFLEFGTLPICGNEYRFSSELVRLPAKELKSRIYRFGGGYEDTNKVKGLKAQPFAMPLKPPLFVFIFKESERNSGNELFRALIGKGYPSTFSGMKAWFDCEINTNNVTKIIIDFDRDYNASGLLASELAHIIDQNSEKQIIGIFIDSYSHNEVKSENYIVAKQVFFSAGVPLQVVRNDRIIQTDGLKWAISGIGLQLFSKLGGIPWEVKPSTNNCLIFGVGQAHDIQRIDGRVFIKKYFAYSVCFDSTGVYRSLGVLSDTNNKAKYYVDLGHSIISQVEARIKSGQPLSSCVIHTPYRMRNDEMGIIKESVNQLSKLHVDIEFTVMRINTSNRFYGFADNNIKIPYESTYVQLSAKEYLVWFEGLKHGREYINKRIANPTYIDFWYGWQNPDRIIQLLQDAVNLAGASWRGFNAKLEPISIFYPQLIARFIREFRKLNCDQDMGEVLMRLNTPWFL
ncbi:Piwi domain-containing protein [Sphaerochaeta sp.]|uniref:Piwi domain-containing protein n=1 Tax=Sphaerochaeta sp. TaxID=1972642 RepID=UPI002FC6E2AC